MTDDKHNKGQFYTTNWAQILCGFSIPPETRVVIEPFCGQGHLLEFVRQFPHVQRVETYDIDPWSNETTRRDTLKTPPNYKDKFVLTNPPFLARNKCKDKTLFDQYGMNDLFKCFLTTLLGSAAPDGGILILPLNFFSSIRKADVELRSRFLTQFRVLRLNVFEGRSFEDTSYTICSLQFEAAPNGAFDTYIFSSNAGPRWTSDEPSHTLTLMLDEKNDFTIGGEIYAIPISTAYTVSRLVLKTVGRPTNILLKAMDDCAFDEADAGQCISLRWEKKPYVGKVDSRSYATLVIEPEIDKRTQRWLIEKFNAYLTEKRKLYHSLFLPNYRDKGRKRIPFELAYRIISNLLREK